MSRLKEIFVSMEDAAAVREMEETVIETDEYAVDMLKEEK